jgi:DNA modification methylase
MRILTNWRRLFKNPEKADLEADVREAALELGYSSADEYLHALHQMYRSGHIHVPKQQQNRTKSVQRPRVALRRKKGKIYRGDSAQLMNDMLEPESVDLIVTSPPFGLVKKKPYGNEDADEYLDWFDRFAPGFQRVLKEQGSLVIDIGGAYQKGRPARSLYHFELVVRLCRAFGFYLAQEFYWWNPSRLPLPAEWVNVRRIRVRDSVNVVWWLSKTPYPRANNRRILQPYSDRMRKLHERGTYNSGIRPGGQDISEEGFLAEHGGSIPHNLIALANTESKTAYQKYCRDNDIVAHPARFPSGLPAFFIRFLTDRDDLVLDPFAGSCVTGEVAEQMGRRWICCELEDEYVKGAKGRFSSNGNPARIESARTKPYDAYPPTLSVVPEEESPLPLDGGRHRPT